MKIKIKKGLTFEELKVGEVFMATQSNNIGIKISNDYNGISNTFWVEDCIRSMASGSVKVKRLNAELIISDEN